MGTLLPVPEIDHWELAAYIKSHSTIKNFLSTFSASKVFVVGVFSLNIFPYVNATIIIQLLTAISPKLAALQKDGDFAGQRAVNQLTRQITLGLAILQSSGISIYLNQILFNWNFTFAINTVICLTTGAMIVLWLSEMITEYGLGNGSSLLIYTNIVSNLPNLIKKTFFANNGNLEFFSSFSIIVLVAVSLYSIILLQEGIRKVPLISAKQLEQRNLRRIADDFLYLPLRFNQAGVLPIILATSVLVIPTYLINFGLFPIPIQVFTAFEFLKFLYWPAYFALVIISSSFYSALVLKPKDLAEQLQKMTVVIPGVRSGRPTVFYLRQVINRLTFIGSFALAILTVIPNFLESTFHISGLNGLSTTSLLILAGVLLDLSREITNIYYSNVYNERY